MIDDLFSRNFAIFYKAEIPAGVSTSYEIQISTSDGSVNAIPVEDMGFQWGYRQYTDQYPLVAAPPSCL